MEWRDKVRFACVACLGFMLVATVLSASRASMLMWFTSGKADGVITREADPKDHNYVSYEYKGWRENLFWHGLRAPSSRHAERTSCRSLFLYFFTPLPSESVIVGKDEQRGYGAFGIAGGLLMGAFVGFGDCWNRQRSRSRPL